jgi:hypothetical protein
MIKMDIEGGELNALLGMESVLRKWLPVLFIEVSAPLLSRFGQTPGNFFAFLATLGYESYRVKSPARFVRLDGPFEDELVMFMHPSNKR